MFGTSMFTYLIILVCYGIWLWVWLAPSLMSADLVPGTLLFGKNLSIWSHSLGVEWSLSMGMYLNSKVTCCSRWSLPSCSLFSKLTSGPSFPPYFWCVASWTKIGWKGRKPGKGHSSPRLESDGLRQYHDLTCSCSRERHSHPVILGPLFSSFFSPS